VNIHTDFLEERNAMLNITSPEVDMFARGVVLLKYGWTQLTVDMHTIYAMSRMIRVLRDNMMCARFTTDFGGLSNN
jgi:hypothetical protein